MWRGVRAKRVNANASILATFATVGMMYAARLAGMDWQFTLLVGCCIGLAALHRASNTRPSRTK